MLSWPLSLSQPKGALKYNVFGAVIVRQLASRLHARGLKTDALTDEFHVLVEVVSVHSSLYDFSG